MNLFASTFLILCIVLTQFIYSILRVFTYTFVLTLVFFRFLRASTLLLFHQHVNELLCHSCSPSGGLRWLT